MPVTMTSDPDSTTTIEDGEFSYLRARRSSASVDSPPPTSMMDGEQPAAPSSMSASELSRCGRYQLTAHSNEKTTTQKGDTSKKLTMGTFLMSVNCTDSY
jgi:hypothetical protein